jgi:hypothetical protein
MNTGCFSFFDLDFGKVGKNVNSIKNKTIYINITKAKIKFQPPTSKTRQKKRETEQRKAQVGVRGSG